MNIMLMQLGTVGVSQLEISVFSYTKIIPKLISLFICRNFKIMRKYLQFPLSKEEEEFPLAYSMVVHHKVWESNKYLLGFTWWRSHVIESEYLQFEC